MQIQHNVSLKDYSTMRLGGTATAAVEVTTKQELIEALGWAEQHNMKWLVLGGGSNVIFSGDYDGLIIHNKILEFKVISNDTTGVVLHVGAGEIWDSVVARTVDQNWQGLERLSAIPGTAGGTPVQNVGAYGSQISDVFVELEAYDVLAKKFVTLSKEDCQFGYRTSIFKSLKDRRYVIVCLTLRLSHQPPQPPFYENLDKYLREHNITTFTVHTIRDAVRSIRAIRLPDPSIVANSGSFFKNPAVSAEFANSLLAKYPDMPHWPMPDERVKLAAGWLIEQSGLRDYHSHGMRTFENHALVLINESAKSYDDLAAMRQEIVDKVREVFEITLHQEPELL